MLRKITIRAVEGKRWVPCSSAFSEQVRGRSCTERDSAVVGGVEGSRKKMIDCFDGKTGSWQCVQVGPPLSNRFFSV